MKSFLAVVVAAAIAPAFATHSASSTVTISPCPSSTASTNDIVTRTPMAMPSESTPCPTLSIVKTNGTTVTMSHDGAGSSPSMTPASFTGAAMANNAGLSGAIAAAFGLAAFAL